MINRMEIAFSRKRLADMLATAFKLSGGDARVLEDFDSICNHTVPVSLASAHVLAAKVPVVASILKPGRRNELNSALRSNCPDVFVVSDSTVPGLDGVFLAAAFESADDIVAWLLAMPAAGRKLVVGNDRGLPIAAAPLKAFFTNGKNETTEILD